MCALALLLLVGPRLFLAAWFVFSPETFANADMCLCGLGWFFFPWTTLGVFAFSPNGLGGFEVIFLAIALVFDLFSLALPAERRG